MASRMRQLQDLANDAREKGDKDEYEMIRGDIFKEFNFDIGKFVLGGIVRKKKKAVSKYARGGKTYANMPRRVRGLSQS